MTKSAPWYCRPGEALPSREASPRGRFLVSAGSTLVPAARFLPLGTYRVGVQSLQCSLRLCFRFYFQIRAAVALSATADTAWPLCGSPVPPLGPRVLQHGNKGRRSAALNGRGGTTPAWSATCGPASRNETLDARRRRMFHRALARLEPLAVSGVCCWVAGLLRMWRWVQTAQKTSPHRV